MPQKIDVEKIPLDQADRMFELAAMSSDERGQYLLDQKLALAFRATTPEFVPTARNAEIMSNFIEAMGVPKTLESLENAYQQLDAQGALEKRKR
jgi:hypothetical protein